MAIYHKGSRLFTEGDFEVESFVSLNDNSIFSHITNGVDDRSLGYVETLLPKVKFDFEKLFSDHLVEVYSKLDKLKKGT